MGLPGATCVAKGCFCHCPHKQNIELPVRCQYSTITSTNTTAEPPSGEGARAAFEVGRAARGVALSPPGMAHHVAMRPPSSESEGTLRAQDLSVARHRDEAPGSCSIAKAVKCERDTRSDGAVPATPSRWQSARARAPQPTRTCKQDVSGRPERLLLGVDVKHLCTCGGPACCTVMSRVLPLLSGAFLRVLQTLAFGGAQEEDPEEKEQEDEGEDREGGKRRARMRARRRPRCTAWATGGAPSDPESALRSAGPPGASTIARIATRGGRSDPPPL